MAVTYSAATKDARMTAVRDEIDSGGAGQIIIGTAGLATVLAEFDLETQSGTISAGVLTFASFPKSDTAANNSGTAAEAKIVNGSAADVVTTLTVGTSGSDVNLDSTTITAGQTVTLNSATITHF